MQRILMALSWQVLCYKPTSECDLCGSVSTFSIKPVRGGCRSVKFSVKFNRCTTVSITSYMELHVFKNKVVLLSPNRLLVHLETFLAWFTLWFSFLEGILTSKLSSPSTVSSVTFQTTRVGVVVFHLGQGITCLYEEIIIRTGTKRAPCYRVLSAESNLTAEMEL